MKLRSWFRVNVITYVTGSVSTGVVSSLCATITPNILVFVLKSCVIKPLPEYYTAVGWNFVSFQKDR